jgi:ABC-type uncharacterized transport system substrate-binding protein
VAWAAQQRLPVMYFTREFVEAGDLMTYGPDLAERHRHAAAYVDKILHGATPANLPVEQPIKLGIFAYLPNYVVHYIVGALGKNPQDDAPHLAGSDR